MATRWTTVAGSPAFKVQKPRLPPRAGGPCMKGVSQGLPSDLRPRNQHGPSVHPDNPSPILSLTGTPRTRGTSGARRKYCEYPCGLTTLAKAPVGVGSLTAAEMATGRHAEAMGARGGHKGARGGHRRDTRAAGECDSHGGHMGVTWRPQGDTWRSQRGTWRSQQGHVEAMGARGGHRWETWRPQATTQGPWGHVTITMGMCAGHKGTYKAMRGTRDGHSETPVATHQRPHQMSMPRRQGPRR